MPDRCAHILHVEERQPLTFGIDEYVAYVPQSAEYTGPYVIEPTQHVQTIPTAGKTPTRDIVVSPIPSNFGLITWTGQALMVS